MANTADATGEVDGEEGARGKPKSKFGKKQIMIAGGVAALLVAGGGAYMFLGASEHEEAVAAVEKKPVVFIDMPDMLVNLVAPSDRPKYLKIKIALEVADQKTAEEVTPLMPRVTDSFQTHLREMRPEDLEGSAGMYRLREELLRRINQAIYPAKVDAILFKELLVQ